MNHRFFKNAGFLAIIEMVLKVRAFIVLPLLTHHFGTIDFGVWSQVGVLVAALSPVLILGTDAAAMRYLPGCTLEEKKSKFLAWLLFLGILSSSLCLVLFWLRGTLATAFWGSTGEYESFVPLAAALLFITVLLNSVKNWYRICNDAKSYGLATVCQSLLELSALVIMLLRNEGVYELVSYTIAADFAAIIWLLARITQGYGWGTPDFKVILPFLRFGLPLIPAGYAMWGLNWIDRMFLVKYSTLSEIGIYSLVYGLGYAIIQLFVNPIWSMYANTASELYSHKKYDDLQKLFDQSIGLILLLTLPSIVGLVVLGERLLMILAPPEFLPGAPLMAIITVGYLFHMLGSYFDITLGLAHRQHLSTFSILIAFGVNFILNMLLIPHYSILGAAIATSMAFFVQFLASLWWAKKYLNLKANLWYPAKIMFASLAMGAVVYGLSYATESRGVAALLSLTLFGVLVYGAALVIFRVVAPTTIGPILTVIKARLLQ